MTGSESKKYARRRNRRWALAPWWIALALLVLLAAGEAARADLGDGKVTDRLDQKAEIFRKWLPQALRGDSKAQFELGVAYASGRAEPEDYAEAVRWLDKAAAQGNARAQSTLGLLYIKGLGVPRDYVKAYAWFDLAARRFGHGQRRDQAIELRTMMAAFMTAEQLAEARRLAVKWRAEGAGEKP